MRFQVRSLRVDFGAAGVHAGERLLGEFVGEVQVLDVVGAGQLGRRLRLWLGAGRFERTLGQVVERGQVEAVVTDVRVVEHGRQRAQVDADVEEVSARLRAERRRLDGRDCRLQEIFGVERE